MQTDEDLLVVEQHPVDVLDSEFGSLQGLVMNEPITLGSAEFIGGDLGRQDGTKGGKGVVKGLVIDAGLEVLDEDVAGARLASGRVALGPHDPARTVLDQGVVERLKRAFA